MFELSSFRLAGIVAWLCAIIPCGFAQTVISTPTFNNVGIVVTLPSASTGSVVRLFQKPGGAPAGSFHEIHPLSQLTSTRFAGSAFGLEPGTTYDFKLTSASFASDQFVSATTRSDSFPDATNATYYVSAPGGNDGNNGSSPALAFKTLAKALSVANAGAKVLLADGIYYEGDLSPPRSGTASQPIIIENVPGAKPVLSGLDTSFSANWSDYDAANHIYRTPCTATPENAYLNGGQFYHFQDLADMVGQTWPQPGGYFVDGSFLYARFPNDSPPGTNIVTIPAHTTALTLSQKSNLQIRGIEFCYYGLDSFHRAIYIDGGDSNLVDRCFFHQNGVGVALKRAADFNTIQHCVFTEYPVATWSWHAVKDGGTDYESGGVLFYGSTETNRGNVIRFCAFTNMFDGAHLYSDDATGPTEDMDFYNNLIDHCVDDAIETDGAGSNCRIYFNRFHDFLTGVSAAPCAIGPTYIFRNVLSGWRSSEEFTGYPFKFNVGSNLPIQWVYLYHNTCSTTVPGQHGFWFKQYSNWTNIVSRNNIYAGTDYALENQDDIPNTVSFDYDCIFTTKPAPVIKWASGHYNSLGEFAATVGQETHGLTNEPAFLAPSLQDFYLPPGSPLIDKAALIPGINEDYLGAGPDIGALEHGMEATSLAVNENGIATQWHVGASGSYRLEYTTNLAQPTWTPIAGPVQAAGTRLELTDSANSGVGRFYRLAHAGP